MDEEPRGIRLCNPGNIRISDAHWFGKVTPSEDSEFETFCSMEYGVRAIAKILRTYHQEGLTTLRQKIEKWAPPSDNNPVGNYVEFVAQDSGFDPDEALDDTVLNTLGITAGIIKFENGGLGPITLNQIADGVKMAFA